MLPQDPPACCSDCPLRLFPAFENDEISSRRSQGLRTRIRRFANGEFIFRIGDRVREAYTLFDGYVVLYRHLEDGGQQVIRFVLPGDLLYNPEKEEVTRRTSAKVVDHAVICVLSHQRLTGVFENEIGFAHAIAHINKHEERLLEEHITDLGRRPAFERVGRLLLELFHRQRLRNGVDGTRCYLPFTQEQIGDAVGLSSVYVSRLLGQFQDLGLLTLKRHWLNVPDFDAAAQGLEYSPTYIHPRPLI